MRPGAPGTLLALAGLALGACGYAFTARYVAKGGAERVHVRAFENRSTEPELGAVLTSALRGELARRGASAPEDAPAVIEGEVRASEPVPTAVRTTSTAARTTTEVATWRIGIEVRARLVERGASVAERVIRREGDFLGGADPRESEGRRALALRRLAADAARDVLVAFER